MNFNAPLPLREQAKYHEGSKLASPRDTRNVSSGWKKAQSTSQQQNDISQVLQKMSAQISKMRRKPLGGGMPSVALQDFQVVSDGGDWYNCYTFDGVTTGGSIVKVAKHQELRCILPTATPAGGAYATKIIRGITYTYTYTPTAGVTADGVNVVEYVRGVTGSDSSTETDYVTPCLNAAQPTASPAIAGDIITAFQTSFAGPDTLVDVTWQALADGRAWAAAPTV